jgi:hypothetical protein
MPIFLLIPEYVENSCIAYDPHANYLMVDLL